MTASNTLYADIKCPHCGSKVTSGIGFRAGTLDQGSYRLGEKLTWKGSQLRPSKRPSDGNLKTIGYFECDNLKCASWHDCFPEVQEALISVCSDVISKVEPFVHKPNQICFDIIEPKDVT